MLHKNINGIYQPCILGLHGGLVEEGEEGGQVVGGAEDPHATIRPTRQDRIPTNTYAAQDEQEEGLNRGIADMCPEP